MISIAPKPAAVDLTSCIEASSPPQVNIGKWTASLPLSRCKNIFQLFLVTHSFTAQEDAQEQGLSETPAAPQSAPASTAQVLQSQSGSGQSTSASTTARVPPTVAPPALGDDDLRRIVEELYQRMNAGSRPTSTSTPKRDRQKVQGLHQEVETDAQRIKNLVSIFVPYDCLRPTSGLLRDMLGICSRRPSRLIKMRTSYSVMACPAKKQRCSLKKPAPAPIHHSCDGILITLLRLLGIKQSYLS